MANFKVSVLKEVEYYVSAQSFKEAENNAHIGKVDGYSCRYSKVLNIDYLDHFDAIDNDNLCLSSRAINCLRSIGVETMSQLVKEFSVNNAFSIRAIEGLGKKTFKEISEVVRIWKQQEVI